MTTAAAARVNPYVGPGPFVRGQDLYGRDREKLELLDLLIAERIVLLYSPSGAGKTSLVQAALVPALERQGFVARPVMKVGTKLPAGLPMESQPNRYVLSSLISLEEALPREHRTPDAELAGKSFHEYLKLSPTPAGESNSKSSKQDGDGVNEVLIFDQFEEILTVNPTDLAAKEDFFRQVGTALRDRNRWALFSMREDYIAGLDPYLRAIPTRLHTTYRLDLLGEQAALQAVQQPAVKIGIEFTDAAAGKLVDNLRRVRVQRPNGSIEDELGPYIEPVQLQVVCKRLWDRLPEDATQVLESDVAEIGDVDTALADYYAKKVAEAASQPGSRERDIREWFQNQLITKQGIRGQVLQGHNRNEGLNNDAIRALVDAYLVREEKRRGATWFELAHDRLIEPVRANNARWFEANLSAVQREAALWDKQNRPNGLLLRGQALVEGERWASKHAAELKSAENDFLEACRHARRETERMRRLRISLVAFTVFAIVAAAAAVFFVGWAYEEQLHAILAESDSIQAKQQAEQNKAAADLAIIEATRKTREAVAERARADREVEIANSIGIAASALANIDRAPKRSLLTAVESISIKRATGAYDAAEASTLLHELLFWLPSGEYVGGPPVVARITALSRNGQKFAAARSNGSIEVRELGIPNAPAILLPSQSNSAITAMSFSDDARWLASGTLYDGVFLWDLQNPQDGPKKLPGQPSSNNTLAFSPDGRWLAIPSYDGSSVRMWDLTAPLPSKGPLVKSSYPIQALAFSPDGRKLAFGVGKNTWLCDLPPVSSNPTWVCAQPDADQLRRHESGYAKPMGSCRHWVAAIAFSSDGDWLAFGGLDVLLYDRKSGGSLTLTPQVGEVMAIAFSQDSRWLAIGGKDRIARLWDLSEPLKPPAVFIGHESAVNSLAFYRSFGTPELITGSENNGVMQWRIGSSLEPVRLARLGHNPRATAFSHDGKWLATGGTEGGVFLWNLDNFNYVLPLQQGGLEITAIEFSADDRWLVAATDFLHPDGTSQPAFATAWDMKHLGTEPISLKHSFVKAIAFSPDGRRMGTSNSGTDIRIWDLDSPYPFTKYYSPESISYPESREFTFGFSRDVKWLAAANGTDVQAWDLTSVDASRYRLFPIARCEANVSDAALSPDGHLLAATCGSYTHVWNISKPTSPVSVMNHAFSKDTVAINPVFSKDGRWFAARSEDGAVVLLQVQPLGGKPILLPVADLQVTDIRFSPDGHQLATPCKDGSIRLWNLENLDAAPAVFFGRDRQIQSAAFSEDGRWYVTVSEDNRVSLWRLHVDDLIKVACGFSGRNFSQTEWRLFMGKRPYHKTCPELPLGEGVQPKTDLPPKDSTKKSGK
jgi:WD40 repeat protein